MNIHFRRMEISDLDTVFKWEHEIFSDAWSHKSFEFEVNNHKISYPCVLEQDSIILGYAVIWFYAGEVHIGNFAIIPDSRRKGLGKMLLQHVLDKFADSNSVYLEVRRSNKPAIKLYKQFGFSQLMVRKAYYPDGEDAIVMYLNLILDED